MKWDVVLLRVVGVQAALGVADAFLPSSTTLGRDLLSNLLRSTNAAESQAVTTREEAKEGAEGKFVWNKQVFHSFTQLSREYTGVRMLGWMCTMPGERCGGAVSTFIWMLTWCHTETSYWLLN